MDFLYVHRLSDSDLYGIAYAVDVLEGDRTEDEWNAAPRLANRTEVASYVAAAMENAELDTAWGKPYFTAAGVTAGFADEQEDETD